MMRNLSFILPALVLSLCFSATGQLLRKEETGALKFRHIGPIGNRVSCAIGISGNDQIYFAGAASGGLWKTSDAGLTWKPVFDDKNVASVSALAAAPSDPNIIFAGTGESFIRSNVSIGNGVYKSTDGGETWSHSGLDNTGRISRIIIHPANPDVIFVAAVGHAYAPQKERGLHKSTDGGKTWRQVLFIDENTGISDLVIDPANPRVMYAGAWQLSLRTWNRTSGGPGGGLFQSIDGGETWTRLRENGLPKGPVGKIALAMSPASPGRVYALIETGDGLESMDGNPESGELWRSDDNGKSWSMLSENRNMSGRQAYYTRIAVAPDNGNEIHFIQASFHTSIDGGRTLETSDFSSQPYGDNHDMWIDPKQPNRQIVAHDGGISISTNRGKAWHRIALPIAQLYHVTVDNNIPYNVLTNRQDGPSMRGPSRSGLSSYFPSFPSISTGMWHEVGGGESGFATPDPKNPDVIWSTASGTGAVGGVVVKYNEKNRQYRQVEIWPEYVAGHPANEVKYRFQWTFPFLISPHDNNTVYATSQHVHRSTNGGQSWQVISPDLTLNDKSKQQKSGGLTPDNIGVEYANVIYAFEESPVKQGVFWTGSNDGQVYVSQNNGKDWLNVTKNLPELPPLGTIRNIEASRWNEGKAWLVVDLHEVGNFQPFVYRTDNYGKTWKKITKGIEGGNLNYCRSIKEDPIRKGLLYLGTETKLYVSYDDGDTWQTFMNNLPPTPYYWIEVQEHFNDLVLGTYGRGVWILDDITPLQQHDGSAVKLFQPHDTYRFQPKTSNLQFLPEPSWGNDPPYGVSLNYYTASDKDSVKIYITSEAGDTVKTFKEKGKTGFNRLWWGLDGKSVKPFIMRTHPVAADWVPLDKNRTRTPYIAYPFKSFLVAPGKYNVTLVSGNQTQKLSFQVKKDPHSDGTLDDIAKQNALLTKIHRDLDRMVGIVNETELIRRQLYDLRDVLNTRKDLKSLTADIGKLDTALIAVESRLIQLKFTGTGQDDCRYPDMLAGKMGYLAGAVATADFAPADQHGEVYEVLHKQLEEAASEMNKLTSGNLKDFLKKLEQLKVAPVITSGKMY